MKEEDPELELRVQVLNINEGFNEGLKEACRTLKEYMRYVDKVREYAKDMSIDEAVERVLFRGHMLAHFVNINMIPAVLGFKRGFPQKGQSLFFCIHQVCGGKNILTVQFF